MKKESKIEDIIKKGPPIKLVSYLEILEKKKKRRERIFGIEKDLMGYCFHIGKISYGCMTCFKDVKYSFSEKLGSKCNLNCSYCFSGINSCERTEEDVNNSLTQRYRDSLNDNYLGNEPKLFAFTDGEPLLYLKRMEKYMLSLKEIEKRTKTKPYYKIYTNGVLANKDNLKKIKEMGIHEIRFHPSASSFSNEVYKNMEMAVELGFIVAVEEPCWPKNKEKLFEMLPIINKIGVRHLQMCSVEVYDHNLGAIYNDYPQGTFFHDTLLHLYDDGLVYDIMEEVLKKKYKFSVLDCSSEVHRIIRANSKKVVPCGTEEEFKKVFLNPWEEKLIN